MKISTYALPGWPFVPGFITDCFGNLVEHTIEPEDRHWKGHLTKGGTYAQSIYYWYSDNGNCYDFEKFYPPGASGFYDAPNLKANYVK